MGFLDRLRSVFAAKAQDELETRIANDGGDPYRDMIAPFDASATPGTIGLAVSDKLDERYKDYEKMDAGEFSTALDIYADEATQLDVLRRKTVWVTSKDKKVADEGNALMWRTLRIEDKIWAAARLLCKYGNDYFRPIVGTENQGVVSIDMLAPPDVRRYEKDRILIGFAESMENKFPTNFEQFYSSAKEQASGVPSRTRIYEEWQISHSRLIGKRPRSIYGYGVLEGAREPWKYLKMMEDATLLRKLTRSPFRLVWSVEIVARNQGAAKAYISEVKRSFRKRKFWNPQTGGLDFKYNPLSMDEDIFLPMYKGQRQIEVDQLPSQDYQPVEDLQYFLNKALRSTKIPPSRFGYENGQSDMAKPLSMEDVHFARATMRVQRELVNSLEFIYGFHLEATGRNPDKMEAFTVNMAIASAILELARIEVLGARADFMTRLEQFVSTEWLLTFVFDLSKEQAEELMLSRLEEKRSEMMFNAQTVKNVTDKYGEEAAQLLRFDVDDTGNIVERSMGSRIIPSSAELEMSFSSGNGKHQIDLERNIGKVLEQNQDLKRRMFMLGSLLDEIKGRMVTH